MTPRNSVPDVRRAAVPASNGSLLPSASDRKTGLKDQSSRSECSRECWKKSLSPDFYVAGNVTAHYQILILLLFNSFLNNHLWIPVHFSRREPVIRHTNTVDQRPKKYSAKLIQISRTWRPPGWPWPSPDQRPRSRAQPCAPRTPSG